MPSRGLETLPADDVCTEAPRIGAVPITLVLEYDSPLDVFEVGVQRVRATIEARAEVIAIDGRRVRFAVAAFSGQTPLMKGVHERVVVDLERFLAKLRQAAR